MTHKKLEYISIPLMGKGGVQTLRIGKNEFGDPNMLTLELPPAVVESGRLHLPRSMFNPNIARKIRP